MLLNLLSLLFTQAKPTSSTAILYGTNVNTIVSQAITPDPPAILITPAVTLGPPVPSTQLPSLSYSETPLNPLSISVIPPGSTNQPKVGSSQKAVPPSPAPQQRTTTIAPMPSQSSVPANSVPPTLSAVRWMFEGKPLYRDPNTSAASQVLSWNSSDPTNASLIQKIADNPQSVWFGNWNADVQADVNTYVSAATQAAAVPVLVLYNIPQRDCGGYSAGGSDSAEAYQSWINAVKAGINSRPTVVILEPDALPMLNCLNSIDQTRRLNLLNYALTTLKQSSTTAIYLDAGHPGWVDATTMAGRLQQANVALADGFSLNVSNFYANADLIEYGTAISQLINNKHFVLDTSRNGNGVPTNGEWCNPDGRSLGVQPSTSTGIPLVDAYLWIKTPGESDGTCNGGPSAGTWWSSYALGLASRASW